MATQLKVKQDKDGLIRIRLYGIDYELHVEKTTSKKASKKSEPVSEKEGEQE